jgi:hypothetical protein
MKAEGTEWRHATGPTARHAGTLIHTGKFGKARDTRRGGAPGCLGRDYRRVYRLLHPGRERRQHLDKRSCVLDRMFQRLFHEIRLDRRNLLLAMRFAKPFDVPGRALKRLPRHLRDRERKSEDGGGCRGHFGDRAIIDPAMIDRAIDASAVCPRALSSHFFLLMILDNSSNFFHNSPCLWSTPQKNGSNYTTSSCGSGIAAGAIERPLFCGNARDLALMSY